MKLSSQLTIHASADKVWSVIAHDFARIGEWASGVAQSKVNIKANAPNGATVGGRVCSVPGFGDLEETFTHYDEAAKTFTYKATGMPFFVTSAQNSWYIQAIDAATTEVSFSLDMQLMPVVGTIMGIPMRIQLVRLLDNVTEELKHYIETGDVHPRKQKLIAKVQPNTSLSN